MNTILESNLIRLVKPIIYSILKENLSKNKQKPSGYSACYTYKSSFGVQLVYVKYDDDVKAIDLLLGAGLEKQAVVILDNNNNKFKSIKSS